MRIAFTIEFVTTNKVHRNKICATLTFKYPFLTFKLRFSFAVMFYILFVFINSILPKVPLIMSFILARLVT
jgi:hypothetical protein